jgi:hypothetical protein
MRALISTALISLVCATGFGATIHSSEIHIEPSVVHRVIRLVDKVEARSSQKKLSIVVTDRGMSTDVSPRFNVYLSFASLAEMGNIFADFEINVAAVEFVSAKRTSPGIYVVKTHELRDAGMYEVSQTINASKMFVDEKALRDQCGDRFCDHTLKTTIEVTEKVKKISVK